MKASQAERTRKCRERKKAALLLPAADPPLQVPVPEPAAEIPSSPVPESSSRQRRPAPPADEVEDSESEGEAVAVPSTRFVQLIIKNEINQFKRESLQCLQSFMSSCHLFSRPGPPHYLSLSFTII